MKWEYKVIKYDANGFLGGKIDTRKIENELNSLGRSGWELVNSFDTNTAEGKSRYYIYNLKKCID